MLERADLVAFVPVTDVDRARAFYVDVLGLGLLEDTPFALVLDANGTVVRVTPVGELTPHPFTVLGWTVSDIAASVDELVVAGVSFEHFDGVEQDDRGIWAAPSGARVAWFKDPDGNLLSLTQGS